MSVKFRVFDSFSYSPQLFPTVNCLSPICLYPPSNTTPYVMKTPTILLQSLAVFVSIHPTYSISILFYSLPSFAFSFLFIFDMTTCNYPDIDFTAAYC